MSEKKLYGYIDTNEIYTPYHFRNCSKNGCITKQYLGYTIKYNEQAYCGSCDCQGSDEDTPEVNIGCPPEHGAIFYNDPDYAGDVAPPVDIRGNRYYWFPNFCCYSNPKSEWFSKELNINFVNGLSVIDWTLDIQSSPTNNCYQLRNNINEKLNFDLSTPAYSETNLETIASKICTTPAKFSCSAENIRWLFAYPTVDLTNLLRESLFPYMSPVKNMTIKLNNLFNTHFLPEGYDILLDFGDHIYDDNYQRNCQYNIKLQKEIYSAELEIDLIEPDFIDLDYTTPAKIAYSSIPQPCIRNPILGNNGKFLQYNNGVCDPTEFPCQKELNPLIIRDYETGKTKEPVGCCKGLPQENYCCNKDFDKKIETLPDYECFDVVSQDRTFIGVSQVHELYTKQSVQLDMDSIKIHCAYNELSNQFYLYTQIIPICVAEPQYMVVNIYDVVVQGVCENILIEASGSGEYCDEGEVIFYDPHEYCINLNLTYKERKNIVAKTAVTLEYYYCEITYEECGS